MVGRGSMLRHFLHNRFALMFRAVSIFFVYTLVHMVWTRQREKFLAAFRLAFYKISAAQTVASVT